jgi:large subunit ribosomal protein L32
MANPKRRHSHSRTRLRRGHDFLSNTHTGTCPKCGQPAARHQICGYCGFYRGVEVIKMEAEAEAATEETAKAETEKK